MPETTGTDTQRTVTFNVAGDFDSPTFRKARQRMATAVEGSDMQEIWVVDHVGGGFVQLVHQSRGDADFGRPSLPLAYGTHELYFIASRGTDGEIDTDGHTVTWGSVKDTFYKLNAWFVARRVKTLELLSRYVYFYSEILPRYVYFYLLTYIF